MKITKRVVGAGVAGLVAASGLGVAVLAAPATAATTSTGSGTTAGLSGRLHRVTEALSGLVTDGTLTQAQADRVAHVLSTGDALRGGGHHRGRLVDLRTAATTLGLSEDALRTALRADGASLASVAAAHGVSEQTLVDALVGAAKDRLALQVSEGHLTQAQADARTADLPARVEKAVQAVRSTSHRGSQSPAGASASPSSAA